MTDDQAPLPATTTMQQDIMHAGQRRISMIWEVTQSFVTIAVVLSNMIVATMNAMNDKVREHPVILSTSLFLILGFYYSRTNHSAIGGVGPKPQAPYEGR